MRAGLLGSGFDPLREILASSFRKGCAALALTITVAAVIPQARAADPIEPPQLDHAIFMREIPAPPAPRPQPSESAPLKQSPESDVLSGIGSMALGTLVTLAIEIALCTTTGICAVTMPP
jgi:hypothetical protein